MPEKPSSDQDRSSDPRAHGIVLRGLTPILDAPRAGAHTIRMGRAGEQFRVAESGEKFVEIDLGLRGRGFVPAADVDAVVFEHTRTDVPQTPAPVPFPPDAQAVARDANAAAIPLPAEPKSLVGDSELSVETPRGLTGRPASSSLPGSLFDWHAYVSQTADGVLARVRALSLAGLTLPLILEAACFAVIFSIAVAVRVHKLGTVPEIITGDETDNLQIAYHILAGTGPGIFGFDWKPAPIFSLYPLAWTMRLFGHSVFAFRMFPVLLSLATLAAFYVVARARMRAWAALPALLLLATNLWVLHFSRTAWENMNAALFALGACYCVERAIRTRRLSWWALTGVFTACGLYGYFTGRFIFVAVMLSAFIAVATRIAPWRATLKGLALAGVVSAVLFAPMANHIYQRWDYFNQRTKNVSVFSTTSNDPYFGDTNGWVIAFKNVGRNFRGLILQDGKEFGRGLWARYNPDQRAPLDAWVAPLFWFGLLVAAFRWRQTYVLWTFFVPLAIAEVFSKGTPDLARATIIAPFYFLFIGVLFEEIYRRARGTWTGQAVGAVAIAAIVVYPSISNVRDYFEWQERPAVQNARLPGVDVCEFPAWRTLALNAANAGSGNLNPNTFAAERVQLNCSSVVSKWLAQQGQVQQHETSPADRDNQRVSDLAELQQVLADFRQSHGSYPNTKGNVQTLCAYENLDAACALHAVMKVLPRDPQGKAYWYRSDGTHYTIYAEVEGRLGTCQDIPEGFFTPSQHIICVNDTR